MPDRNDAALQTLTVNLSNPIFVKEVGDENRWVLRRSAPFVQGDAVDIRRTPRGLGVVLSPGGEEGGRESALSGRDRRVDLRWTGPENPQNLNRYAYVQNNPLRYTDPSGYWTFGIGVGYTLGAGTGFSGSVLFVFDIHGRAGIIGSAGGGGYAGMGGGASLIVQATDAEYIQELNGAVVQTGGSAILGPDAGLQGGFEWLVQKGPKGPINGANIFIGGAGNVPVPLEMHSMVEYGRVVSFRSIFEKVKRLWNKMEGW